MATAKIILGKRRKDGTSSLDLQVIHARKHRQIPLEIWVMPEHFINGFVSDADHKHKLYNRKINEFSELADRVIEENSNRAISIDTLRDAIYKKVFKTTDLTATVDSFSKKVISDLREAKKDGNADSIETAFKQLFKYTKKDLSFVDLNYKVLTGFKTYKLSAGCKVNTIGAYFRAIRMVYNEAIHEGIVDREHYPFLRGLVPGAQRTPKRAVDKSLITFLESATDVTPTQQEAIDFVLSQFYLRGADFGDVARLTSINECGGYIEFARFKNRNKSNPTPVRVKIINKLRAILNKYQGQRYLLPVLNDMPSDCRKDYFDDKRKHLYNAVNRVLKRNGFPLISSKPIRHTWATIARQYAGYDLVHVAMGHAINDITGTYIDYRQDELDQLNDRVCNAIELQVVHQKSA
jgi:integrase